jgi:hypothetical protein
MGNVVVAISCIDDLNAENYPLWSAVFVVLVGDGVDITLYVRGGYFQDPCLGRILTIPIKYDKLFQSPNHMAQGSLPSPAPLHQIVPLSPSFSCFFLVRVLTIATSPMAIFQTMGHDRRH